MANGQDITRGMGYPAKVLGFKTITLWTNPAIVNCTAVETMMYHKIHHQPLGQRLHRIEGAGANGTNQIDFEREVHHVFMAYSYNSIDHINNTTIKINP